MRDPMLRVSKLKDARAFVVMYLPRESRVGDLHRCRLHQLRWKRFRCSRPRRHGRSEEQ